MALRLGGLATMAAAVVIAATSLAVAGWSEPEPSVDPGTGPGAEIVWVLPGGPAWADGIRPGQRVIELRAGVDRTEWRLETTAQGGATFGTSHAAALARLRAAAWPSVLATVLAGLAWVALRRFWLAVGIAVVSLVISAQVLPLSGTPALGTVAVVGAMAGLALWLAGSGVVPPRWRRTGVFALPLVIAVAWVAARHFIPTLFDPIDLALDGAAAAGILGIAISAAQWQRWRGAALALDSARVADLVALAAVLATSVFAALIVEGPLLLLVALALALVFLNPRFRRRISQAIDQVLLGDIRSRASLRAVEDERGRIARDLHDEPLQEIAAAIRLLDQHPDTAKESELLRSAAGHLRRVTTELRPPVLDDLGLAASIAFIADQASSKTPHIDITATVVPDDVLADRPPADIELAVFRIIQEAVDNASRHAGARTIRINALITPTEVSASVEDDGTGVSAGAAREAMLEGHVGLVSMAQRAAHIGAAFEITGAHPQGTIVRVEWKGRR